ncbi:MAG: S-layer homology domain-containing protein [Tissierellaceae bacterium]
MSKRIIALLLVLSLIFPTNLGGLSIARAETKDPPLIEWCGFEAWEGTSPKPGQKDFFIYFYGKNLLGEPILEAELSVKEGGEFVKVASQVEGKFQFYSPNGDEYFVSRMSMDGDWVLESGKTYYIDVRDQEGQLIPSNFDSFVNVYDYSYPSYVDGLSVDLLPSNLTELSLDFILSIDQDVPSFDDIGLDLVTGNIKWGRPEGPVTIVGQVDRSSLIIDEDLNGTYSVSADFQIQGPLSLGHRAYVRISYGGESAYSFDFMEIIDGYQPAATRLNFLNAYGDNPRGHGEGGTSESGHEDGDPSPRFYISSDTRKLDFELIGTRLSDEDKLSVAMSVYDSSSSFSPQSIRIEPLTEDLYRLGASLDIGDHIPVNGQADLDILYHGETIASARISRTSIIAASNLRILDYWNSGELDVLSSSPLEFVLENSLNIDIDKLSASLNKGAESIDLSASRRDNHIVLSLDSHSLLGKYYLDLSHKGEKIRQIYYDDRELHETDFFFTDEYPLILNFVTSLDLPFSIDNWDNSLTLIGSGFSPDKSYEAYFIKRKGHSLNSEAFALNASYQSPNELYIGSSLTDALPRGWYTVYLKANGQYLWGHADTALKTPRSGGSAVVLPTVKINDGDSHTLSPDVTISLSPGSYDMVRFAESEAGLEAASWRQIHSEIPYRFDDYGTKTLYFQFRSSKGADYSTSQTILYRRAGIGDMEDFGIQNAREDGDLTILNKGNSYTIFIQSTEWDLMGRVEYLDQNGESIDGLDTISLNRTASKDGIHTYSRRLSISDQYKDVKALRFYLRDIYDFKSKEEVIRVNVQDDAIINNSQTKLRDFFSAGTYLLEKSSPVEFRLWATPGFNAKVLVNYRDTSGQDQTLEKELEWEDPYYYKASLTLREDTARLVNVEYILEDPENPTNTAQLVDEIEKDIGSNVTFTGLANQDGVYDGKFLSLTSQDPYVNKRLQIVNNQVELDMKNLPASDSYLYSIWGLNKVYGEGSFSLDPGVDKTIDLSNTSIPVTVKFTINQDLKNPSLFIDSYGYAGFDRDLEGFEMGEDIKYTIYMSSDDMKLYKAPEDGVKTLNTRSETIGISLDELEKFTFNGRVIDAKKTHKALEDVQVNFSQAFTNKIYIHSFGNTKTDSGGNFSIDLYKGENVNISLFKDGYEYGRINEVADDLEKDLTLSYGTKNNISVNLFTYPYAEGNQALDKENPLSLDSSKIHTTTIYDEDDNYISGYFYTSRSSLVLQEDGANKRIKVKFGIYNMVSEEEYYYIDLDEYGNGNLDVFALSNGKIEARLVSEEEDAPTAYMMVYDGAGTMVGLVSNDGLLSTESISLKDGNYTVLLLKGHKLDKLKNFRNIEDFNLLSLREGRDYVKKSLSLSKNRLVNLGDITIPNSLSNELFSLSRTSISTKYVPDNGNGVVYTTVRFTPENIDPEADIQLDYFNIRSSGELRSDEIYFNGQKTRSSALPYLRPFTEGILYFEVIPPDMDQLNINISLQYTIDGKPYSENIGLDNIDTPKVSIIPPSEVFMGEDAKSVMVRGIGLPGSDIEIYDNGILVGKLSLYAFSRSYETSISLVDYDTPMAHTLYAKMITKEGEEHFSVPRVCEIIDPDHMAYVSDFVYNNSGNSNIVNKKPKYSNENVVFSYSPWSKSIVRFRINNLLKDQLSYVALVLNKNGHKTYYEAEHMEDVDTPGQRYSSWVMNSLLEDVGDLSVYYSLKLEEETSLSPISGSRPIDFEGALEETSLDQDYLPDYIGENIGSREINKQTANELDYIMPIQGGGSLRITGQYSENHRISEESLRAQGYRKFDTMQGYYWAKESLQNDGDYLEYHKSMYFSPELTAMLNNNHLGSRISPCPMGQLASNLGSGLPTYLALDTGDVLSKADYSGYVYNLIDLTNDTSANPANFGKVGTGMQVMGGVVLAGQILSGPSTKDHNALYQAAAKIDDAMIRSRIGDDIRAYDKARRNSHTINVLFGGVSYGAGFFGPVGKGLSYIVSTGSGVFSKKVDSEYDLWWDSIMKEILAEVKLQEYKKKKKGKPPWPGKEDDEKMPKWKIDPSGYVFEAIDSDRIQGVEATVLVKKGDEFLFWDEAEDWDEINPLYSDEDGRYGWDVPHGEWMVHFEKDGYLISESKSMKVPPAHDQVNIGLLSTQAPDISGVSLDSKGLEIEFDMFVQEESLEGNLIIMNEYKELVPIGEIEILIGADNTGYVDNMTYQKDIIPSSHFVKRIRLLVNESLYPGGFKEFGDDGETKAKYSLEIRDNLVSYAGVNMAENYSKDGLELVERLKLDSPTTNLAGGNYEEEQVLTISGPEGARIYYTLDNSEPTALSRVYKGPLAINKTTVVKFFASKLGMDDSDIVKLRYNIGKDLPEEEVVPPSSGGSTGSATSSPQETKEEDRDKGQAIKPTIDEEEQRIVFQAAETEEEALGIIDKESGHKLIQIAKSNNSPLLVVELEASQTLRKAVFQHEKALLSDILGETQANLVYRSPLAEVKLTREAMDSLANIEGQDFSLSLEKEDGLTTISFEIDGKTVKDIDGQVLLALARENASPSTVAALVMEDGSLKIIGKTAFTDKTILMPIRGTGSVRIIDNRKYFTDSEGHWGKDSIDFVASRELFKGTGEDAFSPDESMTRAMLVTVLHRLEDQLMSAKPKFTDVADDKYYANAIGWASSQGLVKGVGDGKFAPEQPITREELATILYRYSGLLGLDLTRKDKAQADFQDYASISDWAREAMDYCLDLGLIQGKGDRLDPGAWATRAELATVLQRLIQNIN